MQTIVEKAREFVEEECKKPSSKYGYQPYPNHFVPVHDYAKKLAEIKSADIEVVELAAWMHDIGSIIHGREDHHITGAEIAEERLRSWGYSEDKISKVKHCIYAHRGSQKIKRETIEAEIIAEADAMSHFDNVSGIFQAAFVFENKSQKEAQLSVLKKLRGSRDKLSSEGKKMIEEKYNAAEVLFNAN